MSGKDNSFYYYYYYYDLTLIFNYDSLGLMYISCMVGLFLSILNFVLFVCVPWFY